MGLKEYLAKNKIKAFDMAKDIGMSRFYFSSISTGKMKPSIRLAKDIVRYTEGLVTLKDLGLDEVDATA